jgi:hypothetical protein
MTIIIDIRSTVIFIISSLYTRIGDNHDTRINGCQKVNLSQSIIVKHACL